MEIMTDKCPSWLKIELASDREINDAARVDAAQHVRACSQCRTALRRHVALRKSFRLTFPILPIDPALSARVQSILMFQRNAALQTWLRRCTAVAAAVLVVCTLSATFAYSESTPAGEEAVFVTPAVDRETDTPQHVTQWIVQDLSRGR
jgi:anti-sigma factor RsiW